jgi:predicted transcriptional regulator
MAEKIDAAETVRKGILMEVTANIVSAYLGKNSVPGVEIPGLIRLETFRGGRRSSPEFIVCLGDGLKFKSLKRHLRRVTAFRRNYPMVAPNYAATRSRLAKQIGLGRQRRRRKAAPDRTCRRRPICGLSYAAAASAARASERMRSTMERKPLERCGVRCSRKPMLSNSLIASVTRMSLAALPE